MTATVRDSGVGRGTLWSLGVLAVGVCAAIVWVISRSEDGSLEAGANRREDLLDLPITATDLAVRGITDDDVVLLRRFERMQCFDLASGRDVVPQRITARGIREFCELPLPRLKEILIARSDGIDDGAVKALAARRSVELLVLQECGPFGAEGVEEICAMPRLKWLDLRGCNGVTDESVAFLKRLRHLDRGGLRLTGTRISNEGLAAIRAAVGDGIVDTSTELWRADR